MAEKTENSRDEAGGYCRPPKASQFKKGQSGNPLGRPRKAQGRRGIAARVFGVRGGEKVGQWSGSLVLLRGGVKPGHWIG